MSDELDKRITVLETTFAGFQAQFTAQSSGIGELKGLIKSVGEKVDQVASEQLIESGRREGAAGARTQMAWVADWVKPLLLGALGYAAVSFIQQVAPARPVNVDVTTPTP